MNCSKCFSTSINIQAIAEQKRRGCIMSLIWLVLSIFTIGAIIWIPLLIQKGSKTVTYAICQNCGNRWKV